MEGKIAVQTCYVLAVMGQIFTLPLLNISLANKILVLPATMASRPKKKKKYWDLF